MSCGIYNTAHQWYRCITTAYDSAEGYKWDVFGLQSNENIQYDPALPFQMTIDCDADLQIPPQPDAQWGHDINVQVWLWRLLSEQYPIGPIDKAQVHCVGQASPQMLAYNPTYDDYGYYYYDWSGVQGNCSLYDLWSSCGWTSGYWVDVYSYGFNG
jgi:hypothetical protein